METASLNRPKLGVGVIIIHNQRVLLGKRKSTHGEGAWCFPGGHLEFGESPIECAVRETQEEAGIEIINPVLGPYTNDIFHEQQKHYVTLFVIAQTSTDKATVMEPDTLDQWGWYAWEELPQPLFQPIQNLVGTGFSPFTQS